ncbi:MFS transporter [Hippea sp. KM1]|uniref:MFS transporter n=1 Tax=Hippea sp. KM1 TaxID=944481 RepID=UPI00046CDFB8|nr:MFS transporter [Hippea sp. KM1]
MKNRETRSGVGFIIPLAVFLGGIGGGIVFPILPVLGLKLGLSAFFIGLIIAANKLSRVLFNQIAGAAIDAFGGKRPLIIGLIVEAIGSVFYIASLKMPYSGWILLFGRIVWGLGSALVFISANTIALNLSKRSNRGQLTAKVRIALSLGVPAGLVIGGILSTLYNDETAFFSSIVASIIGGLVVWFFFEDTPIEFKSALNIKESLRFMFKNPPSTIIGSGNLITFFAIQGVVMATLVLFVKHRQIHLISDDPRFVSGIVMAFMMFSGGIGGIIAGRIVDSLKYRSTIGIPSVVIVFLGFVLLASSNNTTEVIIALIMIGSAIGINNVSLLSILGDITPPKNRGKAVGVYQMLGDVGGSLGPIFGIQLGLALGFDTMYIMTGFIFLFNLAVFFKLLMLEKAS